MDTTYILILLIVVIISGAVYIYHLRLKNQGLEEEKQELEKEALTDHLTRLWNRRGGMRAFDVGMSAAYPRHELQGKHRKVWAMAIDIDHFKEVNDRDGHQAGDAVLVTVAEIVGTNFRSTDICIRFGGDEFLVLMTNAEEAVVIKKAEEFRQGVKNDYRMTGDHQVTVSIGIASTEPDDPLEDDHRLLETLMERADAALYQAKYAGRNRVVIWQKKEKDDD